MGWGQGDFRTVKEATLPGQQIQDVGSLAACGALRTLHLPGNRFQVWRQLEGNETG